MQLILTLLLFFALVSPLHGATVFMEAGTDATYGFEFYDRTSTSNNASVVSNSASPITGPRDIKFDSGASSFGAASVQLDNVLNLVSRRISFNIKFANFGNSSTGSVPFFEWDYGSPVNTVGLRIAITNGGKLKLLIGNTALSDGTTTLNAGVVYRISIAYTYTSPTVNQWRVFLNDSATPELSASNVSYSPIGTNRLALGIMVTPTAQSTWQIDDVYIDDSNSLQNPSLSGLRVTAKRAGGLGTNNNLFPIGTYTNRWDPISERPLSESNGFEGGGSAAAENFVLESASTGDVNISAGTVIARSAWVWAKRDQPHIISCKTSINSSTKATTTIFPAVSTAVDDLVVVGFADQVGGSNPTITDNLGNTWIPLSGPTTNTVRLSKWYSKISPGKSGSTTVTISHASSNAKRAGVLGCFPNITSSPLDANPSNTTSGTSPYTTPPTGTLAQSGEIIFGFFAFAAPLSESVGSPSEFRVIADGTDSGGATSNASISLNTTGIVESTNSYTLQQSSSTNRASVEGVASFKVDLGTVDYGTPKIIDNGTETAIVLSSTSALYKVNIDTPSYPSDAAGIGMRASTTTETYFYEGGTLIAYKPVAALATKLAVVSVNGGASPAAGTAFTVVVESQDPGGGPANVSSATGVSLSLKTGTGNLGGTLAGTIAAGTNQVTITGVTYTKAESGVIITATRTSGDNLTAGDSTSFTVNPGSPTSLAFITQPGNSAAGATISGPPTVAIQDIVGNTVTSSSASITIAIGNNPAGGVLSGTITKNASAGVASFNDLSINQAGTGYTLSASSSGLTGSTSNAFNITGGGGSTPDLIVSSISNPPATAVAGGSFSVTDTTANTGTGSAAASTTRYRFSLDNTITGTDTLLIGTRSIPSLPAGNNSSGGVSVTIPSGIIPGTYYLGACADDLGAVSESIETNNCTASTSTVIVSAPPSISGLSATSGPVGTSITISGTNFGATQGASTVTFNGVSATPSSWSATSISSPVPASAITGPVVVTVGGVASNGVTFTVTTKLAITLVNSGSNPVAGSAFPVVVQSQDASGTPANVSTATNVSLSLKTGTGTLGGTLTGTIAAGTNQVTISGVTYTKAESGVVLTATRTSGDNLTAGDSAAFTVDPGAASTLVFSTQPGASTAASTITGPPTITVQDSSGNTVTSSTASITIAIGTNPGGGTLSGTTTKNAVSGVASFTDLSVNQSGNGYTLTASSTGLTGATSSAFNITQSAGNISFIKTIGTTSTKTSGISTSITVPASGVAAGNSIIVSLAVDPAAGIVSCTDTRGNSYTSDRDITNGSGTSGVRTVVLSSHNVLSLSSGNTITCTHPSVAARALSANEFSGLAATNTRDQTQAGTGNSTAPSSGTTASTTQTAELLLGTIGVEGPSTETFTAGSNYTTVGRGGTTGGNAATNITVNPEYRVVNATGTYSATGTLSVSHQWAGAVVTYKAATIIPSATKLVVTAINGGSNPTAGVGFSVIVQSQDASGSPTNVINTTGISLSLKTGTGTLGGTLTGTIAAGTNQVTITGVTYTKAESGVVITATRTSGDSLTAGDSAPFTVNPGAATKAAFSTQPGNSTAGSPLPGPPTVVVQDSLGNTVTSSTAAITIAIGTNPNGGTLSGTTPKNASGGVANFGDLSINKAGNGYTLTASATGLTGATSSVFNISAAAASQIVFSTQPVNSAAGIALGGPPTLTVQDSFGNTVTSSTASITVALGANPGSSTLSGTATKNASLGAATFNDLSLNKSGTGYTLTASAAGLTGATSSAFNISAGSAAALVFSTQPGNATAGTNISGPPTVTVQDSLGNTVTSSTAAITVAIGTNPSGGTLSGTTTKNAVSGVASFNDLSINLAGNGYTFTASTAGLSGATSGTFNIILLTPDLVVTSISNPPATALLGGTFSVTDTTANVGSGSAAASTTGYRLSLDNSITAGDPLLTGTRSVLSLGSGSNSSGSITVTIPGNLTPGTYYLGACADNGAVISESNESNNCLASTSTVVISAPPPPSTGIIYIYDRLSRLRAVVDLATDTGIYNYDSVGNVLSIVRQNSSVVSIIEISKNTGPAGTTITIYGTGFSSTCGQNSVTFNGTPATINSCTATQIVTSVPAGATSGTVNVTAPNGSASSNETFNVTPTTGAPVIASFSPSIGEPDASVNISGSGFETAPANNRITFNIARSYGFSATTSNITTIVPNSGTSGRLSVTTPLGQGTSTDDFFVPPFRQPASNVGFTGRMSIGGNSTVNITSGNKMGMVVFDGNQGQQVTLNVSAVTFPHDVALHLQAPDGSSLAVAAIGSAGAILPPVTLPSTGTYTIAIVPRILTRISGGYGGGDGGPATVAHIDGPSGLTMDGQGNIYIADYYNSRIRKIGTNGVITTVAGDGNPTYGGDGGLATSAQINFPWSVTADNQSNLFIADFNNNRIRKVNSSGTITTVAGNGTTGFSGDGGLATNAQLNGPSAVALDGQGNFFITDYNNHRVRKVAINGIITTVAGNGTSGYSGDGGLATSAQINRPAGLTLDAQGNIFIADYNNHRVRKVDVGGVITTVAGNGVQGFSGDGGTATSAQLNFPSGVGLDTQGNLFITDQRNFRIRKVDTSGIITTVAGNGIWDFSGDGGPAVNATLAEPWATIADGAGNLFISDNLNDRIRKVDTSGIITTIAGTDSVGDGGLAKDAVIDFPTGLATDSQGNVYVADYSLSRIRKIAPNGIITTVAGDGTDGYGGDGGPATSAQISGPWQIALDSQGNLYFADYFNGRIRKVDNNGIITTIAGTGVDGYSGDGGPATSAKLNGPEGVAVDSLGNVYIGDTFNHRVRKIDTSGIITTFAGTGSNGFNGDDIPATTAKLYYPIGLAVDSNNNVYIADESNNRVRKVNTAGIISTVSSSLGFPQGVALDAQGNLYISEETNRVRKVDTNGIVSTLTGTGVAGYNGNNLVPTLAQVSFPTHVAVDGQGNIFISDSSNFLLREIFAISTGSLTVNLTTP